MLPVMDMLDLSHGQETFSFFFFLFHAFIFVFSFYFYDYPGFILIIYINVKFYYLQPINYPQ